MYIIPIGWLYVALMASLAEATSTQGSVLGAVFTFLFYGALPVSLVLYYMGAPGRKRAIRAREAAERAAAQQSQFVAGPPHVAGSLAIPREDELAPPGGSDPRSGGAWGPITQPDAGSHAATDSVAPVRKEP